MLTDDAPGVVLGRLEHIEYEGEATQRDILFGERQSTGAANSFTKFRQTARFVSAHMAHAQVFNEEPLRLMALTSCINKGLFSTSLDVLSSH